MRWTAAAWLAGLLPVVGCGTQFYAPPPTVILGVTASQHLVTFHLEDPSTILREVPIGGLAPGEAILGMDVLEQRVHLLGSSSRLYRIEPETARATAVGDPPFVPMLAGTSFGFTAVPVTASQGAFFAIASDTGQLLFLDADTATVTQHVQLGGVGGGSSPPRLVGLANDPAGPGWFVAIDADLDRFVAIAPDGMLFDAGPGLGRIPSDALGLDDGLPGGRVRYGGLATPLSSPPALERVLLAVVAAAGDTGSELIVFAPYLGFPGSVARGRLSLGRVGTPEALLHVAFWD